MRIVPAAIVLLFIVLPCASCKKQTVSLVSQWAVKGVTYRDGVEDFDFGTLAFYSTNQTGAVIGYIYISFGKTPVTSGVYKVVPDSISDNSSCSISVDVPSHVYNSTGQAGDIVNVAVAGSKTTISFTNINLQEYNNTDTATVSGTVIAN
jgi:hypothetical protein